MSHPLELQVNEWHIRAAIFNRFTELDRSQMLAVAKHAWGQRKSDSTLIDATAPVHISSRRGFQLHVLDTVASLTFGSIELLVDRIEELCGASIPLSRSHRSHTNTGGNAAAVG